MGEHTLSKYACIYACIRWGLYLHVNVCEHMYMSKCVCMHRNFNICLNMCLLVIYACKYEKQTYICVYRYVFVSNAVNMYSYVFTSANNVPFLHTYVCGYWCNYTNISRRTRNRRSPLCSTWNTNVVTGLGICQVCTEAIHCVALETEIWVRWQIYVLCKFMYICGKCKYWCQNLCMYVNIYIYKCFYFNTYIYKYKYIYIYIYINNYIYIYSIIYILYFF